MGACAVAKGLYIGPESALQQVEELGITHVLSVVNYELCPPDGVCHWQVHLEDAESANLLVELPAAVGWLERAMRQKGSKVLVHCNAGTSRSPSVVLAAIMKAKGLGLAQALAVLQARAPQASPNPGFMAQLELWGEMGCQLDEGHPAYKQFQMDQVAAQWEEEGYVDPSSFAELPEDQQTLTQLVRYRCRKCRQLLVTEHNVIPQAGVGKRIFRRQRQQHYQQQQQQQQGSSVTAEGGASVEQGSVFVEPMAWMQDYVVGPVQGKLYCTNCQARLGSFNWAGISNSTGAWMIPGFQLHLSRLDVLSPRPPAALAAMRFPAALAEHKPAAAVEQQVDFLPDLQDDSQQDGQQEQQQQQNGSIQQQHGGCEAGGCSQQQQQQQRQQQGDCLQQQQGCCAAGGCSEQHQPQLLTTNCLQQLSLQEQKGCTSLAAETAAATASQAAAAAAPADSAAADGQPWFRYLVLDCDGVLVDTEAASCESLRRAILQVTGVDIPHAFPADFTEVFGMDVLSCIQLYKAKLGRSDWHDPQAIAAAVQSAKEVHYQTLTADGITPLPGAAAIIMAAQQLGLPVGVGSSGAPAKIKHNLTSSGLQPLLDPKFIVSASEVRAGKPAPDVYLEVLRRLECEDASRAVVVEDAVHGLVAAKAAGAFAVGVTNSLPADVLAPHADLVVDCLEQLDLVKLRPTSGCN